MENKSKQSDLPRLDDPGLGRATLRCLTHGKLLSLHRETTMKLSARESVTEQMTYRAAMLPNCGPHRLMKSSQHAPSVTNSSPPVHTLTSHHITKRIGLCWPRSLNEVTTCHLTESTNSSYSLLSTRSRLLRTGHSSWLHGRAKSPTLGSRDLADSKL